MRASEELKIPDDAKVIQCLECRKVSYRLSNGKWSEWNGKLPKKIYPNEVWYIVDYCENERCRQEREEFILSTHVKSWR